MLQVQIEISCNIVVCAPTEQFESIGITVDITDVCTDATACLARIKNVTDGTVYADSLEKRPASITVCADDDDEVWRQLPWLKTEYAPLSQLMVQGTFDKIAIMQEACEDVDYVEMYLAYCAHVGQAVSAIDYCARRVVDVPGGDLEEWAETLVTDIYSIPELILPYIAFGALSEDLLSTDYTSFVDEATDMTCVYRR